MPNGGMTVLNLDTVDVDTLGMFRPASHGLAVPAAGFWLAVSRFEANYSSSNIRMFYETWVNGASSGRSGDFNTYTAVNFAQTFTTVLHLNRGDLVDLRGWHAAPSATVQTGFTSTFLALALLGTG